MHVFSKLPLEDQEIKYLVESDIPSMHASITLEMVLKFVLTSFIQHHQVQQKMSVLQSVMLN
jgi:hypothetical protein